MLAVSRFPLSSSTPCSAFSSGFASVRSGVTAVSKREEGAKAPPPRLLRGADYQQKVSRFHLLCASNRNPLDDPVEG